jgi:dsDNA-specific endonuclease/ATPase MutS2
MIFLPKISYVVTLIAMSKDKIPTLDLHGYKTDEVFDAVDAFLRKHSSAEKVRIIPGKGTGKVMAVVKDYLSKANYPSKAENEGSLIIFM